MITQYFDTSIKMWRRLFIGLGVLLISIFTLNISLGSVSIPLSSVIDFILLRPPVDSSWHLIIEKFRLPKALTATLVGGGLGICGLQMQTPISKSNGWTIHFGHKFGIWIGCRPSNLFRH